MVLVQTFIFVLALLFAPKRGLLRTHRGSKVAAAV
jgi:hypothetical protein